MLGAGKCKLVGILRSIPELEKYKIEEIEEFASAMKEVTFKKNEIIITSNTSGNAMYVISEGSAERTLPESSKNVALLNSALENLDFFGQEVISTPYIGKYLSSVKTVSDVVCWKLDKEVISHIMKKTKAVREGRGTV
jgi:signal-transduction protein with cAMP-binding, CBS, and nucleotidyltransferase domain